MPNVAGLTGSYELPDGGKLRFHKQANSTSVDSECKKKLSGQKRKA